MRTTHWNPKNVAIALAILLVIYLVFSASRLTFEAEETIPNVRPVTVWNYVADFSNMRLLNPTILGFTIIADNGHNNHWKYSVRYTEKLSHWPYWINEAVAHIAVKRTSSDGAAAKAGDKTDGLRYIIESEHQTCFLHGMYCLYSLGTFEFEARGSSTHCRESITFQCPPFMRGMCRTEVEFQRNAIMRNLSMHFTGKHHSRG